MGRGAAAAAAAAGWGIAPAGSGPGSWTAWCPETREQRREGPRPPPPPAPDGVPATPRPATKFARGWSRLPRPGPAPGSAGRGAPWVPPCAAGAHRLCSVPSTLPPGAWGSVERWMAGAQPGGEAAARQTTQPRGRRPRHSLVCVRGRSLKGRVGGGRACGGGAGPAGGVGVGEGLALKGRTRDQWSVEGGAGDPEERPRNPGS